MPICRECGVQIENSSSVCPLCGCSLTPEAVDGGSSNLAPDVPAGSVGPKNSRAVRLFREVFSFVISASILVVFVTDFAYGMDLSWSLIPITSIVYLWLAVFPLTIFLHRAFLLTAFEFVNTGLFLFLLCYFAGGSDWFSELALPLLIVLAILVLLTSAFIRFLKLSILGRLSAGFVSSALFTLCIDLTLNLHSRNKPGLSWSLVAASAVIPIIIFLFGFEKRLKKRGSSLKKYFFV